MKNYDDIINLPHYVSTKRKQMSLENRAAQFAPFSALTGYNEAIKEKGRLTDKKIEIDESRKCILNKKLQIINKEIKNNHNIIITYFIPDNKKNGGKYETIIGKIKKIDFYNHFLIVNDNIKIQLDDIYNIDGDIFTKWL